MQLLRALLSATACFVFVALVGADQKTEDLARQLQRRKEDLSFCFSEDSICPAASDLYSKCSDLQNNFKNLEPWYRCICSNGYVSTHQACTWCQEAYNLVHTTGLDEQTMETCSSYSVEIAPIPTPIIALQSSFNATYTGTVPTQTKTSDDSEETKASSSPTSSAASTGSSSAVSSTSRSSRSSALVSTSTFTFNGGGGAVTTPTTTTSGVQQSATTTPTGASGTGAAPGGRNGYAVVFSVVMFGVVGIAML